MKRSLHNKWIAALREPQRRQGRLSLNDGGAQCCLDVLCEIAGAELIGRARHYSGSFETGCIPKPMAEELGIDQVGEPIQGDDAPLYFLNDEERWTLAQIADELEANEGKYYPIEED